jgi:hypothetical protein
MPGSWILDHTSVQDMRKRKRKILDFVMYSSSPQITDQLQMELETKLGFDLHLWNTVKMSMHYILC